MTTALTRNIEVGSQSLNPDQWTPFEWVEPKLGKQAKGEVVIVRTGGTSGELQAGLWRTGIGIAGCEPDGSCHVDYSAPDADETVVILEGQVTVTVVSTGKQHHLEAGSIMKSSEGARDHLGHQSSVP
jgi:uncharacterized cupin superfamily protein